MRELLSTSEFSTCEELRLSLERKRSKLTNPKPKSVQVHAA